MIYQANLSSKAEKKKISSFKLKFQIKSFTMFVP